MPVRYFFEETPPIRLPRKKISDWIKHTLHLRNKKTGDLNFIFCSDEHLLAINRKFLNHDYFTDIITFDYCEGETISGDVFISTDRVRDNAGKSNTPFETELRRVMIHGILHLAGLKDKSPSEKKKMRAAENEALDNFL